MNGFRGTGGRRAGPFAGRIDWRAPWLAWIGAAVIAAAAALGLFAVAGPNLGFGRAESFVLYQWLGWSRTAGLLYAAAAAAVGLLLLTGGYLGRPSRTSARWRLAIRRIRAGTLVVGVLCVVLVVLEVAVRLADGVALWPPRNIAAAEQGLLQTQTANVYHPDVGWILREGIRSGPGDRSRSFTTGAHGVRMNSEGVRPLESGGVLVAGDSYTAGSEVGDVQTWPAQLAGLLDLPVINGAAGGWAGDQVIQRIYDLLPVVRPRAAVVAFFEDDVSSSGYSTYGGGNKPWFEMRAGEPVRRNDPVPRFEGRPGEVSGVSLIGLAYLPTFIADRIGAGRAWRQWQTAFVRADNDPVAVSCGLLARLHDDLAAGGIPLVFVAIYSGRAGMPGAQQPADMAAVASCARRKGIATADLWAPLKSLASDDMAAYRGLYVQHEGGRVFGHLSETGNGFVARRVADLVAARLSARGGDGRPD